MDFLHKLVNTVNKTSKRKTNGVKDLAYLQVGAELLEKQVHELNLKRDEFKHLLGDAIKTYHAKKNKMHTMEEDIDAYEE